MRMQLTSTKEVQDKAWLGVESDHLETEQEIEIWPYYQMVNAQTRICLWEWKAKDSLGILRYKQITKSQPENQT